MINPNYITHLDNVVRIIMIWYECWDSNSRPLEPHSSAIPNFATPGCQLVYDTTVGSKKQEGIYKKVKKFLEENKCCQLTSALVYGKVYFAFRRNVGIQTWRGGRAVEGTGLENRRSASFRGFESHPLRHAQSKKKSVSSNPFDLQKYPRGRRGSPAKGVGRETGARVQIPPSAPQETALFVGNRAVSSFIILLLP